MSVSVERRIVHDEMNATRSVVLNASLLAVVYCAIAPARVSAAQCAEPNAEAKAVHTVTPAYPREAASKALEGGVTVRVTIGVNGSVTAASVLKTSGNAALDAAAVAAAKASTFTPKTVNCAPTPASYAFHVMFAANGPTVPLTAIHVVPGSIGYARLGIEVSRVAQLIDNTPELAMPEGQRYVDQTQRDAIALMPEKHTEILELRKNLAVTRAFDPATAHLAWTTVMSLIVSHLQRGTEAAKSYGLGIAAAQAIHNAEVFQDARSDALYRGIIAGESVLDANVPHLKDLRDAVRSAAPGDWRQIDIRARAVVDALVNDSM